MTSEQDYLDNLERENLTLSPFSKRALSFFIDYFLINLIFIVAFWNLLSGTQDIEYIIQTINSNIIYILAVRFLYQTFFIWYYGATVGKLIVKIRVIDKHTLDRPTLASASIRSVTRLVNDLLFFIGFFFYFFTPLKQTLHDKLGGVLVVNDF